MTFSRSTRRFFLSRSEPTRNLRPLAGILVLDLGNFLAGPIVSLHLRALGADVIKVERTTGDDSRRIGPFSKDGESSYFMSVNRGKRSVALDTKTDQGKVIFKALAARADILVENFRPGVMDRLGVGYDALAADNAGLIYCSVSGFGPTGPHASRPAFDSLLQAAGGLISATGPAAASEEPVRVGCSIIDMCSGLHSAIAVLAALHQRNATGVGQRIDTSMLATTAMLMESPISRHSFGGDEYTPRPEGLAHPAVAPFDGFKTKDGLLYIATSNDARAHIAMTALGLGHLTKSTSRFATNTQRMANRDELKALIEGQLRSKTTAEWEAELIPAGVPCSAINDIKQLKQRHPEVFVNIEHPTAGHSLQAGSPFALSASDVDYASPAPLLGEHTDTILTGELGFSQEQVARWHEEGVIAGNCGASSSEVDSSSAAAERKIDSAGVLW